MGELKVPIWGKPTIMWGDTKLNIPSGHTDLSMVNENDNEKSGAFFHVPDPRPLAFAFDIDVKPTTIRSIRKMFKYRMPRKTKKRAKTLLAKRLGIKARKLRFNLQVFNNQKRRKRYEKTKL